MEIGGFVYPQEQKKILKKEMSDTSGHKLSENDIFEICSWLTNEQKAYADAIVKYMSEDMAALGNETSMQLFGIKKFKEKYYFPYNSSSHYVFSKQGGIEMLDQRIKHVSFTKATVAKANNSIVLDDFTKIAVHHMNQMCTYNCFAVPLENFTYL